MILLSLLCTLVNVPGKIDLLWCICCECLLQKLIFSVKNQYFVNRKYSLPFFFSPLFFVLFLNLRQTMDGVCRELLFRHKATSGRPYNKFEKDSNLLF